MAAGETGPMSDRMDDPTRLFYAILPDAPARARLDALAREVAERTGGRATRADTLHLTVVFVGTVGSGAVERAREAGSAIAWPRCAVVLDRLGGFSRAKVAWAAPTIVSPPLARAQASLVAALATHGIATESRPWRPHVTLARDCKCVVDGTVAPPILWTVERIALVVSERERNGLRYRELGSWASS